MAQDVITMYEHIEIDQTGIPLIAGTTMKVVELVTPHLAYGWSPEELHFQFPHLTLGEIYAALAYYWDHKVDMDADMMRRERYVEELKKQQETAVSPLLGVLRSSVSEVASTADIDKALDEMWSTWNKGNRE